MEEENFKQALNFIDGELKHPGDALPNLNPATGQVVGEVAQSSAPDVDSAVEAASNAFASWSSTPPEERARYLNRIADLIERDKEQFALAEVTDTGKPLSLARSVDIPRAIANLRFFASAITQWGSELFQTQEALHATLRFPLGPVACISPWNLPLYLLTWKIAPALATGNCVVAKPSELTPTTAYLLSKLCIEASLPPGTLNIVHGTGASAGAPLCSHPKIKAVSFTGGTVTGRSISQSVSLSLKKVSLELGGKNAAVMFADCDIEVALNTTIRSSFSNQGQICLCTSRILVERPLFQQFIERFAALTSALTVGDPLEPATQQGSLISHRHLEKVINYVRLADAEGGEIVAGGKQIFPGGRCQDGAFYSPTVITGLSPQSRVNQEEIFGPLVTITPFDSEEEAYELANASDYGLAATVWTTNYQRAQRAARAIDAGLIWINSWMVRDLRVPFGGTKDSGLGREGGAEALRFFTEPKSVCFSL